MTAVEPIRRKPAPKDRRAKRQAQSETPWSDGYFRFEMFALARKNTGQQQDQRESIVTAWRTENLAFLGDRSLDECMAEFSYGVKRVKVPYGAVMKSLIQRARHAPPLMDAKAKGYTDPVLIFLAKLCRVSATHWGEKPFPLSDQQAAYAIETGTGLIRSEETARKFLHKLRDAGLIERITKGSRPKGKKGEASTYRWLGRS